MPQPTLSVLFQTLRSQSLPQHIFSHPSIILMTNFATTLFLSGLEPRALSKAKQGGSGRMRSQQFSFPKRFRQQGEHKIIQRTARDPSPAPKHHLPSQQGLQTPSRAPKSNSKPPQTAPCSPYFGFSWLLLGTNSLSNALPSAKCPVLKTMNLLSSLQGLETPKMSPSIQQT